MVGWRLLLASLSLFSRHTLPSSLTFLSQQFTVDRENKKTRQEKMKRFNSRAKYFRG
jgi:hypothetical protein